ncbi:hypothetical protein [Bilophila wadsworthia]|uniref:hypothetical protein n=1 Tax=Bilophila wadsworthia TaxID=35833 RepID=UPI0004972E56|nr:hypothetical protein [Bilophila wadsworthia]MCB8572945.1 hypothetical protein [Bilophila wadsworthia]
MSGFARTRARRVEALPEHPCGSRFPGITGESEAMLRLKASILKAAAHGREKGGGERTGHQPCHALPPHGTAWAAPRKAG